jgi:hypothetical protein
MLEKNKNAVAMSHLGVVKDLTASTSSLGYSSSRQRGFAVA